MSIANLNYVINMTAGSLDALQGVISQLESFKKLVEEGAAFPIRIEGGLLDKLSKDVRQAVQEAFVEPPGAKTGQRSPGGAPTDLNMDAFTQAMVNLTAAVNRQGIGADSVNQLPPAEATAADRTRLGIQEAVTSLKASQDQVVKAARGIGAAVAPETGASTGNLAAEVLKQIPIIAQTVSRLILVLKDSDKSAAQELASLVQRPPQGFAGSQSPEALYAGSTEESLTAKIKRNLSEGGDGIKLVNTINALLQISTKLDQRLPQAPQTATGATTVPRISPATTDVLSRQAVIGADLQIFLKGIASQLVLEIAGKLPEALREARANAPIVSDRPAYDLPPVSEQNRQGVVDTFASNQAARLTGQLEATKRELDTARKQNNSEAVARAEERIAWYKEELSLNPEAARYGISDRDAERVRNLDPTSGQLYRLMKGKTLMGDIEESSPQLFRPSQKAVQQGYVPIAGRAAEQFFAYTPTQSAPQDYDQLTQAQINETVRMLAPGTQGGARSSRLSVADDKAIFVGDDQQQMVQRQNMATAEKALTDVKAFSGLPVLPIAAANQLQAMLKRIIEGVDRAGGEKVSPETDSLLTAMLNLPIFQRFKNLSLSDANDQRGFLDVAKPMLDWFKGGSAVVEGPKVFKPTYNPESNQLLSAIFNESVGGHSTSGGKRESAGYSGTDPLSELFETSAFKNFPLTPGAIAMARVSPKSTPESLAALEGDSEKLDAYMKATGSQFFEQTQNRAAQITRSIAKMSELYTAIAQHNIIPAKYTGLLGQGDQKSPQGFQRWLDNPDNTLPNPLQKADLPIKGEAYTDVLRQLAAAISTMTQETLGRGIVATPDDPRVQKRGLRGADGKYYLGTVDEYESTVMREMPQPERLKLPLSVKERTDEQNVGLITRPDQLAYALQWMKGQKKVAVDIETTELKPDAKLNKSGKAGEIRTIQLGLESEVDGLRGIVIDLKAIGTSAEGIKRLLAALAAPDVTKIGHNLGFEEEFFQAKFGVGLGTNVTDTMEVERALLATGVFGKSAGAGLEPSVQRHLGLEIEGKGTTQLSYGSPAALNTAQIRYAITDVLLLYDFLAKQLKTIGSLNADDAKRVGREFLAAMQTGKQPMAQATLASILNTGTDLGVDRSQGLMELLRERSKNYELVDVDGTSMYQNKTTKENLARVTSTLEERRGPQTYDANQQKRGPIAREIGTVLDQIVRDVLSGVVKTREEYRNNADQPVAATQAVFDKIVNATRQLKADLEAQGWSVIDAQGLTLGDDERKVAGTTDIMLANKAGQLGILDTKHYGGNEKRIYKKISEAGGWQDQLEEYARLAEGITKAPVVQTGIFGFNTTYDNDNAVIQDVNPQGLVPVARRTADMVGEDSPRSERSKQTIADYDRRIAELQAKVNLWTTGQGAAELERARGFMEQASLNRGGGIISADETIAATRRQIAVLQQSRSREIGFPGRGEIDALTGQPNSNVSPGVLSQELGPLQAGQAAGKYGLLGTESVDRIVLAIETFHQDMAQRLNKRVKAAGGTETAQDALASIAQSGAFTPKDLRYLGVKASAAEIEIEKRRRLLELSKDSRSDRERARMLKQTDRFIQYSPSTQQDLIGENKRLFAETKDRFTEITKTAARAVATAATARDKARADLQLADVGALTDAEARRAQKRADRTGVTYESNIMDLARKLLGMGAVVPALRPVLETGEKLQAARTGSRALQYWDVAKTEEADRAKEIQTRLDAVTAAQAELASMNKVGGFVAQAQLAVAQTRSAQTQVDTASKLQAGTTADDGMRSLVTRSRYDALGASSVTNKMMFGLNAFSLDDKAQRALEERLRGAFFEQYQAQDPTKPRRGSQVAKTDDMGNVLPPDPPRVLYRTNVDRGMAEVAKIREEREQSLANAQKALTDAQESVRTLRRDIDNGTLSSQKGNVDDYLPEIEMRRKAAIQQLQDLTKTSSPDKQTSFVDDQTSRLNRIKLGITEIETRQAALYAKLSTLLGKEVKDFKEIDAVAESLTGTFKELSNATRQAGDQMLGKKKDPGTGDGGGFTSFFKKLDSLFMYAGAGGIVYGVVGKIRAVVTEINQVDTELARLQGLYDNRSSVSRATVKAAAYETAIEYGTTPLETLKSARIFAQTGSDPEESIQQARAALASQVALNIDPSTATEMLVSTSKVFDDRIKPFELLDRIARLESQYAVNSNDLSQSVQKAGPLFKQFQPQSIGNVDPLDLLLGATTSIVEKTRVSGSQAATSLRFMMSRIVQPDVARSLQQDFGIKLGGSNSKELRPISEIFKDISKRYQELKTPDAKGNVRTAEAESLLVTFAGARQANAAAALLEKFSESLDKASEGSLAYGDVQERLRIQLDTVEGRFGQFNAAFSKLVESLVTTVGLREFSKGALRLGTYATNIAAENPQLALLGIAGLARGTQAVRAARAARAAAGAAGAAEQLSMFPKELGIVGKFFKGIGSLFGGAGALGESGAILSSLGWFGRIFSKLGGLASFLGPVGVALTALDAIGWIFREVGKGAKFDIGTFDKKAFEEGDLYKDMSQTAKTYGLTSPAALQAKVSAAAAEVTTNFKLPENTLDKQAYSRLQAKDIEIGFLAALKSQGIDIAAEGSFRTLPEQITEAMRMATSLTKLERAPNDSLIAVLNTKSEEVTADLQKRIEAENAKAGLASRFADIRGRSPAGTTDRALRSLNDTFTADIGFLRDQEILGLNEGALLTGNGISVGSAIANAANALEKSSGKAQSDLSNKEVLQKFYDDYLNLDQMGSGLQEQFLTLQRMAPTGDAENVEKLYQLLREEQIQLLQKENTTKKSSIQLGIEADAKLADARTKLANILSLQTVVKESFGAAYEEQVKKYEPASAATSDTDNPYQSFLKTIVGPGIESYIRSKGKFTPAVATDLSRVLSAAREGLRPSTNVDDFGKENGRELSLRLRERLTKPFLDFYRGTEDAKASNEIAVAGRRSIDPGAQQQASIERLFIQLRGLGPDLRSDILQAQLKKAMLSGGVPVRVLVALEAAAATTEVTSEDGKLLPGAIRGIDKSQLDKTGQYRQLVKVNADIENYKKQLQFVQGEADGLSAMGDSESLKEFRASIAQMAELMNKVEGPAEEYGDAAKSGDRTRLQKATDGVQAVFAEIMRMPDLQEQLKVVTSEAADREIGRKQGLAGVDRATFIARQGAEVTEADRRRQLSVTSGNLDRRGLLGAAVGERAAGRKADLAFEVQNLQADLDRRRQRKFDLKEAFDPKGPKGFDQNKAARDQLEYDAIDDFNKKRVELTRIAYTDLAEQLRAEEARLADVRESEFQALMTSASGGLREVLMDFDKLNDKPLKTIVQGISGAFQGKIVDNFLDAIYGPMGVATEKLKKVFDSGAALNYAKVYDGHVEGMKAAVASLKKAYIDAVREAEGIKGVDASGKAPAGGPTQDSSSPVTQVPAAIAAAAAAAAAAGTVTLSDGKFLDAEQLRKFGEQRKTKQYAFADAVDRGEISPARAPLQSINTIADALKPSEKETIVDKPDVAGKEKGKWYNFAEASLTMGGQIGGSFLGRQLKGGADYSSEGSSMGAMFGSMLPGVGPFGGLIGGMLGGIAGGLFDKDEGEGEVIPTEVFQKIERNTREAVKAFENQTALLQLDSRFMNVPTEFTVPGYRAGGLGGGPASAESWRSSASYSTTNAISVSVTVPAGSDGTAVGRQVAEEIQRQLGRAGSSFDVRTM